MSLPPYCGVCSSLRTSSWYTGELQDWNVLEADSHEVGLNDVSSCNSGDEISGLVKTTATEKIQMKTFAIHFTCEKNIGRFVGELLLSVDG